MSVVWHDQFESEEKKINICWSDVQNKQKLLKLK